MSTSFAHDYNLESLQKVKVNPFGFDLYVTPRFRHHFETETYQHMTSLLVRQSARGVRTFVDIGAHYGFFDVLVGLAHPNCKILAFEPVPENVAILRKNLEVNSVAADVHQVAVSDVTGEEQFQVSEASDKSGLRANPVAGVLRTTQTDVVRLDQFRDSILDGPVLVKIDTEGNEVKVLEGMQAVIEQCDDVRLMIKLNPRCLESNGTSPTALLERLDQLGFDVHVVLDGEDQYAKLSAGMSWQPYLEGKTHRNLYCVKKTVSLNLCVFSHTAAVGGAESSLLALVDRMTSRYGSVFTVVLPGDGPLRDRIDALGAATMIADYHWWCSTPHRTEPSVVDEVMRVSCQKVGTLVPALSRISPDVVLTNTLVIPWGAVTAMMLDLPHIWWVREYGHQDHGLHFHYGLEPTLQTVRESSNHIVVNSQAVKDALFPDAAPEKCSVATNEVTLRESKGSREVYYQHKSAFKVIIAGTVIQSKGQRDAIQAIVGLLNDGYDIELCVVGSMEASPAYSGALRDLVEAQSLTNRIHFTGFLDNVRSVMEQADLSLTCSKMEAFGKVTAEAMLLGKPVIGTSTGGTPELVEDGVSGFLYSPGDVDRLAEKIAFFADHRAEVCAFGERARQRIVKKLSANPAPSHLFDLCQAHKHRPNPYSERLMRLMLKWQLDVQARLEEQVRDKALALDALRHEVAELADRHANEVAELTDVHANEVAELTNVHANEVAEFTDRLAASASQAADLAAQLRAVAESASWRTTAPLRHVAGLLKRDHDT